MSDTPTQREKNVLNQRRLLKGRCRIWYGQREAESLCLPLMTFARSCFILGDSLLAVDVVHLGIESAVREKGSTLELVFCCFCRTRRRRDTTAVASRSLLADANKRSKCSAFVREVLHFVFLFSLPVAHRIFSNKRLTCAPLPTVVVQVF